MLKSPIAISLFGGTMTAFVLFLFASYLVFYSGVQ